jgi:quercetin dioxygenase-like cupin family protein
MSNGRDDHLLGASAAIAAIAAAKSATSGGTADRPNGRNGTMAITPAGSQPSGRGPADFFTGSVRVDPLFQNPEPSRVTGGLVTFEPGARSNWHTHPRGQTLIVVSGVGWTQCWDEPKQEIRPGDVIWCPPGHKHWHGATATTGMTHIVIQEHNGDGKVVEWLERVSDDQYLK